MAASILYTSAMLVTWLLLLIQMTELEAERILGEEKNDDFDFDGLPGAQHEFKVEVPGGTEECFYQRIAVGATLHVSFEVLRGADNVVDVVIRDSQMLVVDGIYWKPDGILEFKATKEDTYAICVDNTFHRFIGKLVYIYIATFVLSDWQSFSKEFEDVTNIAANLTNSLSSVELSVQEMKKSQTQARFNVIKDFYLVWGNNRYVQHWSLVQCVLVVAAAVVQVYALRRMFQTSDRTPTAKPRA